MCMATDSLHPDVPHNQVAVLASTVSSKMLQTIAQAEGCHFEDTLTGIGEILLKLSRQIHMIALVERL